MIPILDQVSVPVYIFLMGLEEESMNPSSFPVASKGSDWYDAKGMGEVQTGSVWYDPIRGLPEGKGRYPGGA